MEGSVSNALKVDLTIDITTLGRRTNQLIRMEIWFHNLAGRLYITGTPGRRDWYANPVSNPDFTFHLKGSVHADLSARASPVLDVVERRRVFLALQETYPRRGAVDVDRWVESSPLVYVELTGQ